MMKAHFIRNQRRIIVVAILTILSWILMLNSRWIVNMIWINAAYIAQTLNSHGSYRSIAILMAGGCLIVIWDLIWRIYTLAVYIIQKFDLTKGFFLS